MADGGTDTGGPHEQRGRDSDGAAEADDAARRVGGIARLFYPGRHARRAASAAAPPGEEVYRLVGQLVDPDDIVFFDWTPSDGPAEPAGPAGEMVLMTARTLTHVTYRSAPPTAAAGNDPGDVLGDAAATDIAVHRLRRVRSLRWSAEDSVRSSANGRRRGIMIVGDDWEVTVSAVESPDHLPYLAQLLKLA